MKMKMKMMLLRFTNETLGGDRIANGACQCLVWSLGLVLVVSFQFLSFDRFDDVSSICWTSFSAVPTRFEFQVSTDWMVQPIRTNTMSTTATETAAITIRPQEEQQEEQTSEANKGRENGEGVEQQTQTSSDDNIHSS